MNYSEGRERAEKEFNQEIIIKQTLEVYREILLINAKCEVVNVK
jgi:glycosyltransferase involved in cell wall biosynthesis